MTAAAIVPDVPDRLAAVVRAAADRADLVLVIGPREWCGLPRWGRLAAGDEVVVQTRPGAPLTGGRHR